MPLIYDEARKTYDEIVEQLVSNYEEMKDVTVLCKKCHSAARLGKFLLKNVKRIIARHNMRCAIAVMKKRKE